jgi:hypothetical protein
LVAGPVGSRGHAMPIVSGPAMASHRRPPIEPSTFRLRGYSAMTEATVAYTDSQESATAGSALDA